MLFSDKYNVKRLSEADIQEVLSLCEKNPLYYQYFPPFVTEESIRDDMNALPPGKTAADKYYVGYYDNNRLIAVMDLILGFPDEATAYIGFFMTDVTVQSKGIGSSIISELCDSLVEEGMKEIRLCWVKDNPQAEHFWMKNGFVKTGESKSNGTAVVVAHREL